MMASSARALHLYRSLIREGNRYNSYAFSHYVKRRTREEFRKHLTDSDPAAINDLLSRGERTLETVARQSAISRLYPRQRTVIELPTAH